MIVSQSGIAGSTKLGDRVVAGAQVGIVGHIEVANDVMLGARAALTKTIKARVVLVAHPRCHTVNGSNTRRFEASSPAFGAT